MRFAVTKHTYIRCLFLIFVCSVAPCSAQNTTDSENVIIQQYKEKVCSNAKTCNIINDVPTEYRNLITRNCMCDADCSIYDDCCEDSNSTSNQPISDNEFACVETRFSGSIYMKWSCPASWNGSNTIKENCETKDTNFVRNDATLFTPVTSTQTKITFKNLFCALCHNETDFKFWYIGAVYKFSGKLETKKKNDSTEQNACNSVVLPNENRTFNINSKPELTVWDTIIHNMCLDDSNNSFWEWKTSVDKSVFTCIFSVSLPDNLIHSVRFCVPNVIDRCTNRVMNSSVKCSGYTSYVYSEGNVYRNPACLACNNKLTTTYTGCLPQNSQPSFNFLKLEINQSGVPKINRCSQIPFGNTARSTLCEEPPMRKRTLTCFPYRKDINKPCLINAIFTKQDIVFISNNTLYLKPYQTEYPKEEYIKDTRKNTFYICGTYIHSDTVTLDNIDSVATEILIKLSMICLLLQLLIYQQLPEQRNLSGKNLAAFSATLFVALFCFDIGPILPSCVITAMILHYALFSCFTWMLVMSYDCWLSLYRATKFRTSTGKKHTVKFTIYCIVSWGAPLLIAGPAIYIELAPIDVVGCALKSGYGLNKECFIFGQGSQKYFFFIPASIIFIGNMLFFSHTAYMIYISQRNTVNPNTKQDFRLYLKLALLMGLSWTLGSLSQIFKSKILGLLFSVINVSQGIFIFFVFTFKKKTLRSLMEKNKDNRFITTTLLTFVSVGESFTSSKTETRSKSLL